MLLADYRAEPGALPIRRQRGVLGGKAVIAGTRIPVIYIDKLCREGGVQLVRESYPELTELEIAAALFFATEYPEELRQDWDSVVQSFKDTPFDGPGL